MGGRSFLKAVQNPTKKELKNGFYRPRLTLIKAVRKGGYPIELKIELSLPKLFFGNNFDELEDVNFLRTVRLLNRELKNMGVQIPFENLEKASVSAIHYSKNIHLKGGESCSMILNELRKIDLSARIDIGSEKFRNGGDALHFHTNTRDIVFYDKIKDLQQAKISKKRAIEKDNSMQIKLFDDSQCISGLQVFRMEVRLGNRREIRNIFEKIKISPNLNFKELFRKEISKKVLSYFWSEIESASQLLNFKTEGVFELANSLKTNNPKIKTKKLLEHIGFLVLGKEGGTKQLRSFLGYQNTDKDNRKWYAMKKEIKSLNYDKRGNYQAIDTISEDLKIFEKTKLSDIKMDKNSLL
jgi:hypothetical protein